jgi:signal transduction histidine kinase
VLRSDVVSNGVRASYPELMSLAVHELRTPASVVAGYLRMLQRLEDIGLGERERRMIAEAEKSCGRLIELIAELSEVSKIDDGRVAMVPKPIELFSLVRKVAETVHEAEDRGLRLIVTGEGEAPIMGDAAKLTAAFQGIFRAILREQPAAGVVVADCRIEDTSAVIVTSEQSAVAAAYAAPPAPFDELRGGLGLALPIARRVIDAHGGRIWSPAGPTAGDAGTVRSAAIMSFPMRSNA